MAAEDWLIRIIITSQYLEEAEWLTETREFIADISSTVA